MKNEEEKTHLLKKNVNDADVWKTHPFDAFLWTRVGNQPCGEWFLPPPPPLIGVRDRFCLGGLRSVAWKFSSLLAQKSSGFARILHDFCLPENGYLKYSRGLQPQPPPPPPRTPMLLPPPLNTCRILCPNASASPANPIASNQKKAADK